MPTKSQNGCGASLTRWSAEGRGALRSRPVEKHPARPPRVSVLIMAYNHEAFITMAVGSVLMQAGDFDWEILIGEDGSKDQTPEILQRLAAQHPDKIRLFVSPQNLGMSRNFQNLFEQARGEYIAILEGDDFWTAADKLHRQVEFLEQRTDCALCYHPVQVINETDRKCPEIFPEGPVRDLRLEDLLLKNSIPTCSVLFRRKLLTEFPEWLSRLPMIDWPLFLMILEGGRAGCLEETMAAYRIHGAGAWSQKAYPERSRAIVQMLDCVRQRLPRRYRRKARAGISRTHHELALFYEKENHLREALRSSWDAVKSCPWAGHTHKVHWLRLWLKNLMARCAPLLLPPLSL
jgi:hypothetical protein